MAWLLFLSLLERVGRAVVVRLKMDVLDQGSGQISDADGQGVGILKIKEFSKTSYVHHPSA